MKSDTNSGQYTYWTNSRILVIRIHVTCCFLYLNLIICMFQKMKLWWSFSHPSCQKDILLGATKCKIKLHFILKKRQAKAKQGELPSIWNWYIFIGICPMLGRELAFRHNKTFLEYFVGMFFIVFEFRCIQNIDSR